MTERKKPNNKRLILMIVLLAVVIALMWLLPDGSQPAAPATNAPKTEQTKNTNDAPDDIEATTLVKAGTQAISGCCLEGRSLSGITVHIHMVPGQGFPDYEHIDPVRCRLQLPHTISLSAICI